MPWLTVAWGLLLGALVEQIARNDGAARRAVAGAARLERRPARALSRRRLQPLRPSPRSSSASRRRPRCSSIGASSPSPCGSTRCGAGPGTGTAPSPSRPRPRPTRSSNGSPSTPARSAIPTGRPSSMPQSIKHDIDQALDRGYQVVISDVWTWSVDELAGQLGGLSAAEPGGGHLTGCCTTTTRRSRPSAIQLPAPTTSCADASSSAGRSRVRSARQSSHIDARGRRPYRRRGPRSPTGVQLFCKGEVR